MNNQSILFIIDDMQSKRKTAQRNVLTHSSLHVGQPAVLLYIMQHPGCSQKQIADETRVSPASVATSLKRLEKNGMIFRRIDTADTRCNRVYITEAGERELGYCQSELEKIDQALIASLSSEEIFAVNSAFEKMNAVLKQFQKK